MTGFFSKGALRWLESSLILLFLLVVFCTNIEDVSFHPDESQWIHTSAFFEAFFSADFTSPVWKESYWTLTTPPINGYFIGVGRWLGGYRKTDLNNPWDFWADEETNIAEGNMPSSGLLAWSRLPMAIVSALGGLLIFGLISQNVGRVAGYIWVLLFVGNGYLLTHLRRAMSEAPLFFFIVLATAAGARALDHWQRIATTAYSTFGVFRKPIAWFAAMSISCGFAGAAKLNGWLTVLAASGQNQHYATAGLQ